MFGQNKYVDMVENGHMEEEFSEDWSCFWVHEWRTPESQFAGFANIVEDPLDPSNHCAKVVVRSEAEADEAGNKILDNNNNFASWDSQFFIYVRDKIESGKKLKLTMRVRAEKDSEIETQAHFEPGNYNHWSLFNNFSITTEWKKFEKEVVITTDMTQENATEPKEMHTVAFNLTKVSDGNVFYFDDIKLEIKDVVENPFGGWLNMLRNTDLTSEDINNPVVNGYSYFIGRDAEFNKDLPARIIADPVDGQPAMNVTSLEPCRQGTTETQDPETGEITEEPNGTYYQWVERDVLDENKQPTGEKEWKEEEITDWSTQFFVVQPHQFQLNQMVRFVMWARADKPATIETQIHRNPGDYLWYQFLGNFDLTEEWQKFEVETTMSYSSGEGGYTVAFNCNKLREANNYYFRIEEFSINEADATDADRTIGQESIYFPVAANDEPQTVMVDMTEAMKVLGYDNLKSLITKDKVMKALNEEGVFMEEGINPVYDGIILNQQGAFDDNGTINIEVDDSQSADNKAAFIITNTGAALEAPFDSKFCFIDNDGWYYVFNATFVDASKYEDLMGITEFTTPAKNNGAIYDLSGRRVQNVTKGIYIQNGKTFVK